MTANDDLAALYRSFDKNLVDRWLLRIYFYGALFMLSLGGGE